MGRGGASQAELAALERAGQSASEIFRRAARTVVSFGKSKSATTGIDARILRDIGLDRGAAE